MKNPLSPLWWVWWLSLVIKLALNVWTPLAPDEAYYWVWSLHPGWSYMDHPPMVAWLLWLGGAFSAIPHGERIPVIVVGHLTLALWLWGLRKLWSEDLQWKFLMLYLSVPFLGLGSLLATPDVPLLFFWALAFLLSLRWIQEPSRWKALALGAALGLGFCSKYHMVLLPLSLLGMAWWHPVQWNQSHRRTLGLVLMAGLLFSAPVLWWNSQNEWISFRFQMNHGFGRDHWRPHWTGDYLLGQLLLLTPVLWYLYVRGFRFRGLAPFLWTSLIPWLFFLVSSFRGAVQANWPIVSLAPALVLVLASHKSWRPLQAVISFYVICTLIVWLQWVTPWMSRAPDKLTEVHQLRELLPQALPYQPLFGGSYQIASILWYYSGSPVYKLREMSRPDHFDFWPGSFPTTSPFFVVRSKGESLPSWLIEQKASASVIQDFGTYELLKVTL